MSGARTARTLHFKIDVALKIHVHSIGESNAADAKKRTVRGCRNANETILLNGRKNFILPVRTQETLSVSDVGEIFRVVANEVDKDIKGLGRDEGLIMWVSSHS